MRDNSLKFFFWHKYFDIDLKHFFKKYQMFGRGFVLSLCEQIAFSKNAFWLKFDKKEQQNFCDDFNIRTDKFNNMLEMLLDLNFFDKQKFNEYQILTNYTLQEAFLQTKSKKQKIFSIEHKEYMLDCFASKIYEIEIDATQSIENVEETSQKEENLQHTKLNDTRLVDNSKELPKLVHNTNITKDITHTRENEAKKPVDILPRQISCVIDAQESIKNLSSDDKAKFDLLKQRYANVEGFFKVDSKLTNDNMKVATYRTLLALIDLLNVKNNSYTIKLDSRVEHLTKTDIVQMIYELSVGSMYIIFETVATRQDIQNLPFFILGMLTRLYYREEAEKKRMQEYRQKKEQEEQKRLECLGRI